MPFRLFRVRTQCAQLGTFTFQWHCKYIQWLHKPKDTRDVTWCKSYAACSEEKGSPKNLTLDMRRLADSSAPVKQLTQEQRDKYNVETLCRRTFLFCESQFAHSYWEGDCRTILRWTQLYFPQHNQKPINPTRLATLIPLWTRPSDILSCLSSPQCLWPSFSWQHNYSSVSINSTVNLFSWKHL